MIARGKRIAKELKHLARPRSVAGSFAQLRPRVGTKRTDPSLSGLRIQKDRSTFTGLGTKVERYDAPPTSVCTFMRRCRATATDDCQQDQNDVSYHVSALRGITDQHSLAGAD